MRHSVLSSAVTTVTLVLAFAGALLVPGMRAEAGITDTPLPLLNGTDKAKHVYSVVGVQDETNQYATIFNCTSTEKPGGDTIILGVEVFEFHGGLENDVTAGVGVVSLNPGQNKTIGTQDIASFGTSTDIAAASVDGGTARILATSTKILCNAAIVETEGLVPGAMMDLPVYKKTKQKGY